MRRITSLVLVSCAVVAIAKIAPAQGKPVPTPAAAPAASGDPAPAASAEPSTPPPVKNLTGYGYGGGAQPAPAPAHAGAAHAGKKPHVAPKPHATTPIATLPGFEMQADGSSRCFVQLSAAVPIEEKKAAGTLTYILKGAHVNMRNNENALVTVHFNTPVTRARLLPTAQGLAFIIDLRANVAPTYKVVAGKEGSSILEVDFPKGTYVTAADGRHEP